MNDFRRLADLASLRVGGKALAANDDFFAPKENLLKAQKPIFMPDKFTPRGKWMDGWESRRRRAPGFDWCVVRLGMRGIIRGVVVDTTHFTGNYPEGCSLEACDAPGETLSRLLKGKVTWVEVLPRTPLKGDSENLFAVPDERPWSHVRLNIFPDGGVARLRVHGDVVPDWKKLSRPKALIDLAAIENGGLVLGASDMHFGAKDNLILPGRAVNMGDGWETRRRRGPGHDWCLLRLGAPGRIQTIEVDTQHFKGNFPESCSLEGCHAQGADLERLRGAGIVWAELLLRTKLKANARHVFKSALTSHPFTHIRLNIFPDGGVARLRLHGRIAAA